MTMGSWSAAPSLYFFLGGQRGRTWGAVPSVAGLARPTSLLASEDKKHNPIWQFYIEDNNGRDLTLMS